jgi:hypothetical protein
LAAYVLRRQSPANFGTPAARSSGDEFMKSTLKRYVVKPLAKVASRLLAARGLQLAPLADIADLSESDRAILRRVEPFTLTGVDRRASLLLTVDHIVRHKIPGDIVECGVWRGGSMMAVALALMARGDTSRHLYLYDTYEGMTAPTEADKAHSGESAAAQMERTTRGEGVWCEAGIDDVQANLWSTGYPRDKIHFVKGPVEATIPATIPTQIALLRLDTDWYESTRHELLHLYPLLERHGVLIIDDYGHWQGARKAVDEYFAASATPVFLHRVDYTARLHIKTA